MKFFENIKKYTIVLASGSPRRAELLSSAGIPFTQRAYYYKETLPPSVAPEEAADYLARQKSAQIKALDNEIVITADTVVVNEGKILGKPKNLDEAKHMLFSLSGKAHQVSTGVCMKSVAGIHSFSDTATVHFDPITEDEIDFYVNQMHPLDKAGAYGIQEWIGMTKVRRIEGSYYTIMGLPIDLVYQELSKMVN